MKLTIYLFKESVDDFKSTLRFTQNDNTTFKRIGIVDTPFTNDTQAFLDQNKTKPPGWMSYFESHLDVEDKKDILNSHSSLIIVIRAEGRYFAITTGRGFTAINRSKIEPKFGLKVTLNSVNPEQIKGVDSRKVELAPSQKRIVASRDTRIFDFEFDSDAEIIKLITGKSKDSRLASLLSGSDSLSITTKIPFAKLQELCAELLELFKSDAYKSNYPEIPIDRINLVRDDAIIDLLFSKLKTAVNSSKPEKLHIVAPNIDNHLPFQYRILYSSSDKDADDLDLHDIVRFAKPLSAGPIDPRDVKIFGVGEDGHATSGQHTLADYISFQTDLNGKTYLFDSGDWNEVDASFIRTIERGISKIKQINRRGFLEAYDHKLDGCEEKYNKRASSDADRFACLDRDLFRRHLKSSSIEVCDIFTNKNEFVCVKIGTNSSSLSHLFSQGTVSATFFCYSDDYRSFLLSRIPSHWHNPFDVSNPDTRSMTFVFAIANKSKRGGRRRLVDQLPFFSKVNLFNNAKRIRSFGFKIALCDIST